MPTNFPNPWASTLEQQDEDLPLAMVIMVGLWYTDHREGMHPNLLIPQWKIRMRQLLEAAEKRKIVKDLLVLAEVEVPTDRDDGNVHKKDDVDEMNRWLRETFDDWVKKGKQNKAKTRVVLGERSILRFGTYTVELIESFFRTHSHRFQFNHFASIRSYS